MATSAFEIPRAPIVRPKSGTVDETDNYTQKLRRWRSAAYEEAMQVYQLNREQARILTYIDFLEGQHWDPARPRYRSHFFDNRVGQARTDIISTLTDIRPTMDVKSSVQGLEEQAGVARKVLQHEWIRNGLDVSLGKVIDHSMFTVGYWKIGALMPGRMIYLPCGVDTVLPIQPGPEFQESAGVLYRTYKSLQYFRTIWGEKAKDIEKYAGSSTYTTDARDQFVKPDNISSYTWNSLAPQMRYRLGLRNVKSPFRESAIFPAIQLEEYWVEDYSTNDSLSDVVVKDPNLELSEHNYHYVVKPGQRLFPRKRLICFAGDRPMSDGPSPYWHGLYPFAELIINPIVWGPGGLSVYRNLLPINRSVNRIGAGIEDVINRAIRPQVLTKTGSVYDQSWNEFHPDMPGGRLKLTQMGNPMTDVRYMDPPILPGYVQAHLGSYLLPTFDRLAGSIDVLGLGKKNQVPGGETIEQMRDSSQTTYRLWGRHIERFLTDSGIQSVANIFQFYTLEQRMQMLGADGMTKEDFDFDPASMMVPYGMPKEDHWRNFAMDISEGSLHGGAKDRTRQVSISLFRLGGISRREMLRNLDYSEAAINRIEQEIMDEHGGSIEPDAIGKGQVPRLTRGQRTGNPF